MASGGLCSHKCLNLGSRLTGKVVNCQFMQFQLVNCVFKGWREIFGPFSGCIVKVCPFFTCGMVATMFESLIAEARSAVRKKSSKKKDLEERPEVSVGNDPSFPRRGLEGTKTLVFPGASTGSGSTRPG